MTPVVTGIVGTGLVVVVAVRAAVAAADARHRAGDWPWWRCGWTAAALLAHDVLAGVAGFVVLAVVPGNAVPGPAAAGTAGAGTVLALLLTGRLLRRRRGLPVATLGRRGALAQEPMLTLRGRLLLRVAGVASQATSRWIDGRLEACRRRTGVTDEHLLAAVWTPARIRLRETVGVGRTEVALLLLQAQAVVEDASPPLDRLLTLLHLVHDRSGRWGVRAVLDQAARGALRHGRTGGTAWAPAAGGIPGPAVPPSPFPVTAP